MSDKRFNVVVRGYCWIEETAKVTGYNGEGKYYMMNESDADKLCNILNEQHKQIQELQLEIESKSQDDYIEYLKNENQRIKQTIKDMMESERTALGRSVLKQLWEAIQ